MKQETLKKIVELADGFGITPAIGIPKNIGYLPEMIKDPDGRCWQYKNIVKSNITYPLLIRRAVEGWNIQMFPDCNFIIHVHSNVSVINIRQVKNEKDYNIIDYPKTEYLTPQEQAIEACLIELLEGKNAD